MSWYNGGNYEGLTLDQLRYVLAEFCTAINERQAALNGYEWKWVYPGLARPVWSDFTGLRVGKEPELIGFEYVYQGLETTIKEIHNAIIHGWTDVIPHPSNPGSSGVYPLVLYPGGPNRGFPMGDGQNIGVGWTDEDGIPIDKFILFDNAGYGDGWLNPQPLHTNWRVYDQIRRVLEQLVYLESRFQVRHSIYTSPSYPPFLHKTRMDGGVGAEAAWDNAVASTPILNTTLSDTLLLFNSSVLVSRRMSAGGATSRDVGITEETNFLMRVAPLPGVFHMGYIELADASGSPYPFTWIEFYDADPFDVTDQDGVTWPLAFSGEGHSVIRKDKPEEWWADVAGNWKFMEFTQALPADAPFPVLPSYGGLGNPIPFSSRCLGVLPDPLWDSLGTTALGKYVRQLQVGTDLTYG